MPSSSSFFFFFELIVVLVALLASTTTTNAYITTITTTTARPRTAATLFSVVNYYYGSISISTSSISTRRTTSRRTSGSSNSKPSFLLLHASSSSSSSSKNNKVPEYSSVEDDEEYDDDDDDSQQQQVMTVMDDNDIPIIDDNDDNNNNDEIGKEVEEEELKDDDDDAVVLADEEKPPESTTNTKGIVQYGALEPGTVVHVRIGDWSLARKAWKKRRRSGSPLLVPCSVLYADLISTTRWNLIYLLTKFGKQQQNNSSSKNSNTIRISLQELIKRHRTHLKSSLHKHAQALKYESASQLLKGLFNKKVQDTYGVQLIKIEQEASDEPSLYYLQAPLSHTRARKRASMAAVLQFAQGQQAAASDDDDDDNGDVDHEHHHSEDTLMHTGIVRVRRSNKERRDGVDNGNLYKLLPLSAALRVHQEDLDSYSTYGTSSPTTTGGAADDDDISVIDNMPSSNNNNKMETGSIHPAVVFDFDPAGDAGSPLLTLSLNPSRNQVREKLLISSSSGKSSKKQRNQRNDDANFQPKYVLEDNDLVVGDGPITGKVTRFMKGGALIDCNVGHRHRQGGGKENGQAAPSSYSKLLGKLAFKDAVSWTTDSSREDVQMMDDYYYEEDEEADENQALETLFSQLDVLDDDDDNGGEGDVEEEDITHLFKFDEENGVLLSEDPETGETERLIIEDTVEDDELDDDDDDDVPMILSLPTKKGSGRRQPKRRKSSSTNSKAVLRSHQLHIGDEIDVYVKSVSKQSCRYELTMDLSQVKGKTGGQVKKQNDVSKKLSRLEKQLGGDLQRALQDLNGHECNGIIQAASQTGNWFYVQPEIDTTESELASYVDQLPVGVARVVVADDDDASLNKGDRVRIRIDGVDEGRGQLAMQVLRKLAP